jgi:hypothetical protein
MQCQELQHPSVTGPGGIMLEGRQSFSSAADLANSQGGWGATQAMRKALSGSCGSCPAEAQQMHVLVLTL